MKGRLAGWRRIPRLPRRTARLRLTVLYGALFVASGAALLTITYLLVRHSTVVHVTGTRLSPPTGLDAPHPPEPPVLPAQTEQLRRQADGQRAEQLHQLLIQSGVALGAMAVISVGLGWLMAGRVLRPLRTMAAATRRISERNLHERLAMNGPVMSSPTSATRSTACSPGWKPRSRRNAASSPTPRTSSARHWR